MIHVGLPKTGTTSVQGALGHSLYDRLVEDGYYFLGKTKGLGPRKDYGAREKAAVAKDRFIDFAYREKCLFPKEGWVKEHGECKPDQQTVCSFIDFLRDHYNKGHHLAISEEAISHLSHERLEFFKSVLRRAGYERPRIVITSRHYHDLVPSWIQQYFRPAGWNHGWYDHFPDKGGAQIPTMYQFVQDPLPYSKQCHFDDCYFGYLRAGRAPAAALAARFRRHFDDVQLFSFDQEGDLVANFVCQALPHANSTCRGLRDGSLASPPLNEARPRETMDYEYLAQAAYDKYVPIRRAYSRGRRRGLVERIGAHHARVSGCQGWKSRDGGCAALRPLPLACLSDEQRRAIADRTVAYEGEVFPNAVAADGGASLRAKALEAMGRDEGKYCQVDVATVLRNPQWKAFFESGARLEYPDK